VQSEVKVKERTATSINIGWSTAVVTSSQGFRMMFNNSDTSKIEGYRIYMDGDTEPIIEIDEDGSPAYEYTIENLKPSTSYDFKVTVFDNKKNESTALEMTATTMA